MTGAEVFAAVAKLNGLRRQLDQASTLAEFDAIANEYERTAGRPMFFSVEQYDRLVALEAAQ